MTEETTPPIAETVETFYEEPAAEKKHFRPFQTLCDAREKLRDKVLGAIPVEVTEHLVNSRKEFFLAGIAMGEAGVRRADDILKRAKDLHQK